MVQKQKDIVWLRVEIKTPPFSQDARIETGQLLRQLQNGVMLSYPQSRPMPRIGKSCHELRIDDDDKIWRIFYRIDDDAIVVINYINKKTKRTSKHVIELCKKRLKQYDSINN